MGYDGVLEQGMMIRLLIPLIFAAGALGQTTQPVRPEGQLYDATLVRAAPKLERMLVAGAIWRHDTEFGQHMLYGHAHYRPGLAKLCRLAVAQKAEWLVLEADAGPEKRR